MRSKIEQYLVREAKRYLAQRGYIIMAQPFCGFLVGGFGYAVVTTSPGGYKRAVIEWPVGMPITGVAVNGSHIAFADEKK